MLEAGSPAQMAEEVAAIGKKYFPNGLVHAAGASRHATVCLGPQGCNMGYILRAMKNSNRLKYKCFLFLAYATTLGETAPTKKSDVEEKQTP